ncbi:MAG: DUF5106 domain-containing protein [Rikenellaceae bacterium]
MNSLKSILLCAMAVVGVQITAPAHAQLLPQRAPTAFGIWQGFDFQTQPANVYERTVAQSITIAVESMAEADIEGLLAMVIDSAVLNVSYIPPTLKMIQSFFNHPNSPYRSERLYVYALRRIIENPKVSDHNKISSRMRLEDILKNSVGQEATDFEFQLKDDSKGRLYAIDAEYTILFFIDPDCEECASVKAQFLSNPVVAKREGVKILALYPDGDFDLWRSVSHPQSAQWINAYDPAQRITNELLYYLSALPTLYLLDSTKRVVLKNVYAKEILDYLSKN